MTVQTRSKLAIWLNNVNKNQNNKTNNNVSKKNNKNNNNENINDINNLTDDKIANYVTCNSKYFIFCRKEKNGNITKYDNTNMCVLAYDENINNLINNKEDKNNVNNKLNFSIMNILYNIISVIFYPFKILSNLIINFNNFIIYCLNKTFNINLFLIKNVFYYSYKILYVFSNIIILSIITLLLYYSYEKSFNNDITIKNIISYLNIYLNSKYDTLNYYIYSLKLNNSSFENGIYNSIKI